MTEMLFGILRGRLPAAMIGLCFLLPLQSAQAGWPWDTDAGEPIPALRDVTPDIHRGGLPVLPEGIQSMVAMKIKTVINLANDEEQAALEKAQVEAAGIKFIDSPMSAFSTPDEAQVNAVLANLQDPTLFPILIHCRHGEDRTGLIIGLYRVQVQHWTPSQAYEEMQNLGFHTILFPLDNYFRAHTGLTDLSRIELAQ